MESPFHDENRILLISGEQQWSSWRLYLRIADSNRFGALNPVIFLFVLIEDSDRKQGIY